MSEKTVKIAVLKYTVASGKALPNGKIATVTASDARYLCAIGHACLPDDAPEGWDQEDAKPRRAPNKKPATGDDSSGTTEDDGKDTAKR